MEKLAESVAEDKNTARPFQPAEFGSQEAACATAVIGTSFQCHIHVNKPVAGLKDRIFGKLADARMIIETGGAQYTRITQIACRAGCGRLL